MLKTLSLRPYPGQVTTCSTQAEYQKHYKKLHGKIDDGLNSSSSGRMSGRIFEGKSPTYLIWAATPCYLAHELSHVILDVFDRVGIDPRQANGEPFCYLLSQLLLDDSNGT